MSLLPTEEDKAQSRGYAEGLADGKKERYVKLRQGLISRLTTQELIDEICKRDGVTIRDEDPCFITSDNPEGSCIYGDEHCEECTKTHSTAKRIVVPNIVVRKQPRTMTDSDYALGSVTFTKHEIQQILLRLNAPFSQETILEMVEITRKHDAAIRNKTLELTEVKLNEIKQVDDNLQYYLWLEDVESVIESLRTEQP